ncbi:MAG: ABC transporter substrate-binding protein [Actinomycetota bacterium]|nr:ABC transporter substrate-binding protein [Actinomycetota bacterium]
MPLSRREFIIGGVSMAALLAACGTDQEAPKQEGAPSEEGFPRTIETVLGAIAIPARPRRVVTLGYEANVALDLGTVPVGMAKEAFDPSGIAAYNRKPFTGKNVSLIDVSEAVPYEQIAGLRPDVILAGTYFAIEKEFDRLSDIAPVVAYKRGSYVDTWQEQAALIGEALGEEKAATEAVTALERRIAKLAEDHRDWQGKTFTLSFNFDVGQITTITNPDDFAIKLLNQLGLVLSPAVAKLTANVAEQPTISYEQVEGPADSTTGAIPGVRPLNAPTPPLAATLL